MKRLVCALPNCINTSHNNKDVGFFPFPSKDDYPNLFNEWVMLMSRTETLNLNYHRVCSEHFLTTEVKKIKDDFQLITPSTVKPSVFAKRVKRGPASAIICKCSVCGKVKDNENFVPFPSDKKTNEKWMLICFGELKQAEKEKLCICLDHFNNQCIINKNKENVQLKSGSVPTIAVEDFTGFDIKTDKREDDDYSDDENPPVQVERNLPANLKPLMQHDVSIFLKKIDKELNIITPDKRYFSIGMGDIPNHLLRSTRRRGRPKKSENNETSAASNSEEDETGDMCCMLNCRNKLKDATKSGIRFFTFPRNEEICKKWAKATEKKELQGLAVEALRLKSICSEHFSSFDYQNPSLMTTSWLKKDAIPKIYIDDIDKVDHENDENWGSDEGDFVYDWKPSVKRRRTQSKRLQVAKRTMPFKSKKRGIQIKLVPSKNHKDIVIGKRKIGRKVNVETQTPNTVIINKMDVSGNRNAEAPIGAVQTVREEILKVRLPDYWKASRVFAQNPDNNLPNGRKLLIPKIKYDRNNSKKMDIKRVVLSVGQVVDGVGITLPNAWKARDAFILAPDTADGKYKLVIPCQIPKRSKANSGQSSIVIKTSSKS